MNHLQQELKRKSIHLSSLWILVAQYFLPPQEFCIILYIITFFVLLIDVARNYNLAIARLVDLLFSNIIRTHERSKNILTGASFMMIGACICATLCHKSTCMLSLAILIISDTMAAIIGKIYGRHKIFDKTLEGTMAFFCSGVIVCYVIYHLFALSNIWLVAAIVATLIATIVELCSSLIKLDDNLSISLSIAFILEALIFLKII